MDIKKILLTLLLCLFTVSVLAKKAILIVGDSISSGYGIDANRGWVALLQKRLNAEKYNNYRVINASISGDTTSNGLIRLTKALQEYQPDITVIELGGNDGLRGIQLSIIKSNLKKMITLAKQAGSKVLILGIRLPPNYGVVYNEAFLKIYADLAQEENIKLIPLFLKNVDDQRNLMQDDGIHPRVEAQEILLNAVWPTIKSFIKMDMR